MLPPVVTPPPEGTPEPEGPPEPEPPSTGETCALPPMITGVDDCVTYGVCRGVLLDAPPLACAFGMVNGKAACACISGERSVRCEKTDAGVSCECR